MTAKLKNDNDPLFELSKDISLLSLVKKINKKNKHSPDDCDSSYVGKELVEYDEMNSSRIKN